MDSAPGIPTDPPPPAPAPERELYGKRATHSAAGLTLFRVGARLLSVLQLLIFYRLCGEESTGVIGFGLLTLAAVETFSQLGMRKALIQRQGDITAHYGTAFTFQALRGGALALAVFFGAPAIAAWFGEPDVVPVLRAFALVPLMRGIMNIATVSLERNLRFARIIAIDVGTPVIDFVVTVALLLVDPGVMALVWGKVAGVSAALGLSYVLARDPWRPNWSNERFFELFRFGRWLLVTGVITLLVTRGADFVVGKVLSTAEMGVYTLATYLAVMPMIELNAVISRVTFPAYSLIQDDPERLRSAFLRSFLVVTTIVTGVMTLVMAGAVDFVAIAAPNASPQLATIIPLLAVWGACRAMGGVTSSVFMAVGKPIWASYYHAIMLVMLAVTLYPMTKHGGLAGVAWTLAAVGLTTQTIRYGLVARLLQASAWSVYCRTVVPFAIAAVAVASAWALGRAMPHADHYLRLVALAGAAGAVYALGLVIWDRTTNVDVVGTLLSIVPDRVRTRYLHRIA